MLTYLLAYLQLYLQCKYATLLRACRRFDLLLGLGILLHQLRCLMCETMAAGHTTAGMNMQIIYNWQIFTISLRSRNL